MVFGAVLFADDTVIYNSNQDIDTLEYELQEDLNSVSKWLNNNELTFKIKKSKVVCFSTHSRKVDNINLKINDQTLDTVDFFFFFFIDKESLQGYPWSSCDIHKL